MNLLKNQVAMITGAAQGLGRAIALEFAREGATLALLDLRGDKLASVREDIEAQERPVRAYRLDVTDYDTYTGVVEDVIAWQGQIDVLVNNAGLALAYGTAAGHILNDTLDSWRRQLAVNLEAVYMGSKLVARYMVPRHYGRIINIASINGFVASGQAGPYNASKGGVIAYTRSTAVDLAPHNILVNAIAPGFMRTEMSIVDGIDETTTEEFLEWYVRQGKVPLRRVALPEDIAGTAVFLASSYCRYMTGQVLVVDGGLTSTF